MFSFVGFVVAGGHQDTGLGLRVEATMVRVDVHVVTADGQAVTDLTADDFEVREDNVPQAVEDVERVVLDAPSPAPARAAAPVDRAGPSRALTPGERSRIAVVFLDTYHADRAAVRRVHPSLVRQLDALLAPEDVIALMTPEISVRDVTFVRASSGVAQALEPVRQWASRDVERLRDPDEQRYALCFPDQAGAACPDVVGSNQSAPTRVFAPYRGAASEMAGRRHGQRTVQALDDLSRTLRAVNDGRKSVLLLSGGWPLFRENLALARMVRCGPADERRATDREGEGRTRRDGMADIADTTICEADRRRLAALDLQSALHRALDALNTANTTVYPIDTGATVPGPATLRQIAQQTGGEAIESLDPPSAGFVRLARDASAYYLVSYRSGNARPDGAFRRVDVSVKRRGVVVRARRGYRAVTAGEIERQRTAAALAGQTVGSALGAVQSAIESLSHVRASMPVRTRVAYTPPTAGQVRLWAVTEIDTATSREGAWLGGGTVDAALSGADNRALASAEGALAGGQRTVLLDLGTVEVPAAGLSLRVGLRPAGEGPPLKDAVALAPLGAERDPGVPLLLRRGPTTGTRYVPTADPQFRRTERVRVELPRPAPPSAFTASLLDRAGAPLALSVTLGTRSDGAITWATAEVSLAPLAHGDYVIRTTVDGVDAVTAIRVVP